MLVQRFLAALVCVAAANLEDCEIEEAKLLDVQLLQTSLQFSSKTRNVIRPEMEQAQEEALPPEEQSLLQTSLEVSLSSNTSSVIGAEGWQLRPNASCFRDGLLPISGTKPLLLQLGTVHELTNVMDKTVETSQMSLVLYFMDGAHLRPTLVLTLYFCLYVFSIVSMYHHMTTASEKGKDGQLSKHDAELEDSCLEDEVYKKSPLGWLCVSWLNPMVAKLGHSWNSAMSKCDPSDLARLTPPEFQALAMGDRFEDLWKAEVERFGDQASFCMVMMRLWGWRRIAFFQFLLFVHVCVGNLYQVFLIQHSLNYFFWLQTYVRENGGQLPDMTMPILVSIVAFSVQPLLFAVLCSFEANLSIKFDQSTAGVATTLFRKTQRLPSNCLGTDMKQMDDLQPGEQPMVSKKPNAMMVVNNDLIANFHGLVFSFAMTANATVTVALLLIMMAVKLRLATLFCLAVAIPALTLSLILSGAMGINMMQLQDVMDKRIYMIREIMKGIRIVKCYAWEAAMEEQIKKLRTRELTFLNLYFKLCSNFVALFNVFPRVLTCAGLYGFIRLYGRHDLASIFACLQILASLRQESSVLSGGLQKLVTIRISAARIENFLRLEEAPVLPGISEPSWVEIWPKSSSAPHTFKLKGSFKWSREPHTPTVLQDLDLEVKAGELVAIVGSVGSGKSTLLEAALGELYPVEAESTFLSRPAVCGYCAQVPHIAEGTVRENIIFGAPFDEARYWKAVSASGLESDLKLLPGGDFAFIGARGISLSGGQRARVALARAAYNPKAELVLLDDPFGSVDAPTAAWILEELLCGPMLKDRARIVVLQPESERLRKFDRVYVISNGRIVTSGTPTQVAESEDFKQLQRSCASSEELAEVTPVGTQDGKEQRPAAIKSQPVPATTLRESETEGRPTWEMTKKYIAIGKWRNLLNAMVFFSLVLFLYLLCDISLANCTNALAIDSEVATSKYFGAYVFWLLMGTLSLYAGWYFGAAFTLRISAKIHNVVINQLLHAPIDRFFDKHPVGRIMNRITMDMATIDLYLFLKISGSIMILFQTMVPLAYIHSIMPLSMSVLSIPFYYVVGTLYCRYQNTTVPLRYCFKTSSSKTQSYLSDVMTNTVVVRGFGEQQRLTAEYAVAIDDSLKADLTDDRLMKRWLCNRVNYLWTFYNSVAYIAGLYNCAWLGPGTLGIALTNLLLLESMIEPSLDMMAGALFELIALARVHEYTEVCQEQPMRRTEDTGLRNYSLRYLRKDQNSLTMKAEGEEVQVFANGRLLLQSTANGRALVLADGSDYMARFQELCPTCNDLSHVPSLHHLVAANDATGTAKAIAEELCKNVRSFMTASAFAAPPQVVLEFQSNWLASGARLDVQELRAGYAEVPQDVLKGVTFSVEPRMKVAVVGTTGCGKSSMLLALLRIIEPRGGRIVINGIDTRDIGLATLRTALGLVPQEPMLFTGTLRHNLDPFKTYTDGRIKKAVNCCHLESFVNSLPLGLDHQVSDEGGNLSFGQRQLLCLARMVLRQPALLLLDEATSAIDPATQESVQDTINHAFPTSTMLAVAHRLETIMEFDQVVVLDGGRVAEEGPVKEVAAKPDGLFKRMIDAKEKW